MKLRFSVSALCLMALVAVAPAARAQEAPREPAHVLHKELGPADIIMPHITDSKHIDFPCFKSLQEWTCEAELPIWPVTIGGIAHWSTVTFHSSDDGGALVVTILLVGAARSHVRRSKEVGRPKGFAAGLEAVILYLRNEIFLPVLGGHGGAKYVPFCLTLFFFILLCNLFGLVPWGSTPTGNVNVTGTLAVVTFIVVEIAGMRALGKSYIGTIVYWPHDDMPLAIKLPLSLIMTPVEIVGKFTKPFALTVRLFANMIAGHVVILALIGLVFMFGFKIAILPVLMALFIMLLEILVAFIQAFIFALLAAVFIGQIRAAHH